MCNVSFRRSSRRLSRNELHIAHGGIEWAPVPPGASKQPCGHFVCDACDALDEWKYQTSLRRDKTFVAFVDSIDESHRTTVDSIDESHRHCGNKAPAGLDRGPRGPHDSCATFWKQRVDMQSMWRQGSLYRTLTPRCWRSS